MDPSQQPANMYSLEDQNLSDAEEEDLYYIPEREQHPSFSSQPPSQSAPVMYNDPYSSSSSPSSYLPPPPSAPQQDPFASLYQGGDSSSPSPSSSSSLPPPLPSASSSSSPSPLPLPYSDSSPSVVGGPGAMKDMMGGGGFEEPQTEGGYPEGVDPFAIFLQQNFEQNVAGNPQGAPGPANPSPNDSPFASSSSAPSGPPPPTRQCRPPTPERDSSSSSSSSSPSPSSSSSSSPGMSRNMSEQKIVSPFLQGRYQAGFNEISSTSITRVSAKGAGSAENLQIKLLSLLLTDPEFLIIHHLSDTLDSEDAPVIARMLLVLMHANKFVIPPMVSIVQREIAEAHAPAFMFRDDKLLTYMMSSFTSILGAGYLTNLAPLVTEIINKWEDLEIDPSRSTKPHFKVEAAQEKILSYGIVMMEKLLCAIADCPEEYFFVAQIMQIEVLSKFPEKPEFRHQVVADFLFSRFICTALVRPEDFNLYKPTAVVPGMSTKSSAKAVIRPRARRTLAFLSKMLHCIVIGRKPTEPYLRFMDQYIDIYHPKAVEFCNRLASPSRGYNPPALASKIYVNNSAIRHVFFAMKHNMDGLKVTLGALPGRGQQLYQELEEVVNALDSLKFSQDYAVGKRYKKMKNAKMAGERKTAVASAGVGMMVGGTVGTLLAPGVGTVVGAAVGASLAGGGAHQYGHHQKVKREKEIFQLEMACVWDSFKHTKTCYACSTTFSYTNRKHHCRACGHVFCNSCSRKRTYLTGIMWPVRVCDQCYILFPMPKNSKNPSLRRKGRGDME